MATFGYARVSTADQSTEVQVKALETAGARPVRTEKVSGASRDGRTELESLLDFIREGDTLMVTKLDRLGRSTRDVLNIVHELEQKGAHLRVLEPEISTSGPMGKMVLTVLAMVAEMERGFIRERQKAGIEAAKEKGVYTGRKARIDPAEVVRLRAEGMGATKIATTLGIARNSVYRILDR